MWPRHLSDQTMIDSLVIFWATFVAFIRATGLEQLPKSFPSILRKPKINHFYEGQSYMGSQGAIVHCLGFPEINYAPLAPAD